jgi:hypothetical protein
VVDRVAGKHLFGGLQRRSQPRGISCSRVGLTRNSLFPCVLIRNEERTPAAYRSIVRFANVRRVDGIEEHRISAAPAPLGTLGELCENLTAMVGRLGPEVRANLVRQDFERFAAASGDDPKLEEENGRAVAPLLFVCSIQDWHSPPLLDGLRWDGTGGDRTSFLPLDGFRLMGGGQEIDFHAPVLEGTELRVQASLENAELKHGRSGDLVVLTVKTIYADETGSLLVTSIDTLLVR